MTFSAHFAGITEIGAFETPVGASERVREVDSLHPGDLDAKRKPSLQRKSITAIPLASRHFSLISVPFLVPLLTIGANLPLAHKPAVKNVDFSALPTMMKEIGLLCFPYSDYCAILCCCHGSG